MRSLELFAGAGGLALGLHRAGIEPAAFAEIDPWAKRVLARRWPDVPDLGDVSRIDADALAAIGDVDVVAGGFPCTDLSVAGRRAGLHAGEASSLFFEMVRVFELTGADWLLIENVPGLLSGLDEEDDDGEGEDAEQAVPQQGDGKVGGPADRPVPATWFGALLGALDDLGMGWCWRVLDSRHFGVAQRRRRVFVAACRAGAGDPRQVLAVGPGVRRDPPAGDAAGAGAAGPARPGAAGEGGGRGGGGGGCVPAGVRSAHAAVMTISGRGSWTEDGRPCLRASGGDCGGGSEAVVVSRNGGDVQINLGRTATLRTGHDGIPVLFDDEDGQRDEIVGPLSAHSSEHGHAMTTQQAAEAGQLVGVEEPEAYPDPAAPAGTVRRLTPVECERLQAWPDGWTCLCDATDDGPDPGWRGWDACSCPDSPRYRCAGNGVTTSVAEWIGRRLVAEVDGAELFAGAPA